MDALKMKTIYWQKEWKIPNTSWNIKGYSRSAFRTGFYIPELELMLDAGPQCFNKPKSIMVTHSHIDHIACLPMTMIEDVNTDHLFKIYGPKKAEEYITNYIQSMFSANCMANVKKVPNWYEYHGLDPKDKFRVNMNKTNLEIEVFECDHAIPTISYGISEVKTKLKEEYLDLPGKEIGQLKRDGVEITKEVIQNKLAYICDTSIKVFDINPTILNYSVVFIECTFFFSEELENADKTQHIHWTKLKPYVIKNPDTLFVLFHFSQRYRDAEINEFFDNEIEAGVGNIYCWTSVASDASSTSRAGIVNKTSETNKTSITNK